MNVCYGRNIFKKNMTFFNKSKAIIFLEYKYFFMILVMKRLEAKGPFSCLGLQVRFERAYYTPRNYSFLWLVKYHVNSSSNYLTRRSNYLKIIFESYAVLMTKLLAKKI